jgi:hypothetical protein
MKNTWIVSIPTRPRNADSGLQVFVVDAPDAMQAEEQALSRAETDAARRSRRQAELDRRYPPTVQSYFWAYGM